MLLLWANVPTARANQWSRLVKPVLSLTSQEISQEHAALLKNRLYRRWGIKTAREYARIKMDGIRLVGGNPDFTNGDDDARFYDRQQAYVHARGGKLPRHPSLGARPQPELT